TDVISQVSRINRSAGHVMSIFQRDHRRLRPIVGFLSNGWSNLIPMKYAILRWHNPREDAAEGRHGAHFIIVNMPGGLANYFVPPGSLRHDASEITHAAGRNK